MADERVAKFQLKRKKLPAKSGRSDVLPAVLRGEGLADLNPQPGKRLTASSYWFEGEGLNESEKVWKEVLNAAYLDLKSTNWETIPNLPPFPEKCSENDKEDMNTEVFQVGPKQFEWTPFPSFTPEEVVLGLLAPDIQQVVASPPDQQNIVPPPKHVAMLPGRSEPAIHRQTGNKAEESTEHVLKISKKAKSEMPRHPKSKNPTLNSQKKGNVKNIADVHGPQQHAASQNLRKAAGFERLFKTSSQSERNETEGQPSREKQNDPSAVDEKISYVEVAHCVPNIPTEKVNEGMAPLQTCPMCLLQFDQKFSPLDIDSHLAKCLSESTEDIVW